MGSVGDGQLARVSPARWPGPIALLELPLAALVGIRDYERLRLEQQKERMARWEEWVARVGVLAADILGRRDDDGRQLPAPTLWAYELKSGVCRVVHVGDLTLDEARKMQAER